MNTERLETLAAFLDTLPPERLNMKRWASRNFDPADCGTAACAIGWACTIPEFNAAGLRLEMGYCGGRRPTFGRSESWEAVEAFFDLDQRAAEYLFMDLEYDDYATPRDVAARIRKLIADHHVPDA